RLLSAWDTAPPGNSSAGNAAGTSSALFVLTSSSPSLSKSRNDWVPPTLLSSAAKKRYTSALPLRNPPLNSPLLPSGAFVPCQIRLIWERGMVPLVSPVPRALMRSADGQTTEACRATCRHAAHCPERATQDNPEYGRTDWRTPDIWCASCHGGR